MIKKIITLGIILVFGILVYNRFLGTPEEQAQAKGTFQTIGKAAKDVGSAVSNLLTSEKEKYKNGKYDKAMDKIGTLFNDLKSKAKDISDNSEEYLESLRKLNEQKKALQDKINAFNNKEMSDEESVQANEELKNDLDKLKKRIDQTLEENNLPKDSTK